MSEEDAQELCSRAATLFREGKKKEAVLLLSRPCRESFKFAASKAFCALALDKELGLTEWVFANVKEVKTWLKENHGHQ